MNPMAYIGWGLVIAGGWIVFLQLPGIAPRRSLLSEADEMLVIGAGFALLVLGIALLFLSTPAQ